VTALKNLNFKGKIIQLHEGKQIFNFCESISRKYDKVIILTDWDRKGNLLADKLARGLESCMVSIDRELRMRLRRLAKKEINDIESLDKLVTRLRNHVEKMK
jgi:5S rRNA maturation endonuclease (ribonuclease M5)